MNFMIGGDLIVQMKTWAPSGKWSDFVNVAIAEEIRRRKREKAFQMIDELREKAKIRMSTKEMIRIKNYGRP